MSGNSSGNVGEDAPTGEECRRQVVYTPAAWERLFVVGLRKRRPDGRPWAAGCAGLQRNPLLASAWSNAASAQAGGTARMYKLPRGTGEHGSRMKPHGKAMSYFNTRVLCRGERPRMVVEPIEPLVGLPRGPVSACVMTSSPGGGADGAAGGAAGAAPGSIGLISHTLVGLPQGLPRGQRFFFDVGFGGYAHGGAGTPQRWFLERYARVLDVAFDRILIWGDGGGGAPPADEAPFLVTARSSHFALPAAEGLDSCNNPLNFIFQLCAPEDFVVLRLGAAAPTLAARLARDLAGDKRLAGLVDVLYYEDGPSAPGEPAPGEGDPGALADAMSTLAQLRRMGVRAHSWV